MTRYSRLCEPGFIGKMQLKNRIIMPPISTNLAGEDGTVTDELVFHYAERARGGVGLITVENVCVDYPLARHGAAQPRIDDDAFIPGLRRLADAVHEAGALIAVELTHPGMNAELCFTEGQTPVAPAAVPRPKDGLLPKALNREEIMKKVKLALQSKDLNLTLHVKVVRDSRGLAAAAKAEHEELRTAVHALADAGVNISLTALKELVETTTLSGESLVYQGLSVDLE